MRDSRGYWSHVLDIRLLRRRALAAAGAGSLAGAVLAACGGGSEKTRDSSGLVTQPQDTTKQAKRGGTLMDRTYADPPSLSPLTGGSSPHNAVGPLVYSSLMQFKAGYLKASENEVIGDLVESWEWSPDGLQATLKLRQSIKWHNRPPINGRLLDIDDVAITWDRFTRQSSARTTVANVANPAAPVLSLTATDSRTLVMKLKEPVFNVLGYFSSNQSSSGLVVVPKEIDGAFDSRADMIGTGPFSLNKYTPSVAFSFKRNPDYYDPDYSLVDQIEMPIITEYSSALAQFKAGAIHTMGSYSATPKVTPEDVVPLKGSEPRVLVYQGDLARTGGIATLRIAFGWLPAGRSPFRDERVRQAISMALDRDLYLDTFYNVSSFAAEGLPVDARWNTALDATFEGWWLDPKGREFGANAKYFQRNLEEAKKLLGAAGYPNGFETTSSYVTGPQLGVGYRHSEVLDAMIADIGIRAKVNPIDYATEYMPRYRDGKGQYEGWGWIGGGAGAASAGDAVSPLANEFWAQGGGSIAFKGFDVKGVGDQSGDPEVDSMIALARLERDTEKRRALVYDIQRYLAKPWYMVPLPGLATGFEMAWPCVGNFRVYRGRLNNHVWIDQTKPPFTNA